MFSALPLKVWSHGGFAIFPLARLSCEVTQRPLYPVRARHGLDGGAEAAGGREI